ncbi:MAG TPA: hypothetical protein VJT67_09390, partial [Longimicrobiaceae bacterium]|nr:hypothetical protein [Longimicrobiaceae bacterium]
ASATSPTYVEWRREDGQWVIDGFGEVGEYQRFPYVAPTYPALRRSPSPGPVLTLPLAPDGRYASTEPWFRSNGPVWVRGVPRMKYGLPLQFGEGDLTRVGWVEGVPAYVDPADTAFLTVLYLPLDSSGLFQPYQPGTNYFCQP